MFERLLRLLENEKIAMSDSAIVMDIVSDEARRCVCRAQHSEVQGPVLVPARREVHPRAGE